VSRGATQGYCCAFADPLTEESRKRLEAFVSTSDGFRLAELDFELRGPGELFGTRQHGLPPLRIADLKRDQAVLDEARGDAQNLVQEDPGLAQAQHERLRRMVLVRYGSVLELGDVG
jgi:ATP-dependent DNA helicase RecG